MRTKPKHVQANHVLWQIHEQHITKTSFLWVSVVPSTCDMLRSHEKSFSLPGALNEGFAQSCCQDAVEPHGLFFFPKPEKPGRAVLWRFHRRRSSHDLPLHGFPPGRLFIESILVVKFVTCTEHAVMHGVTRHSSLTWKGHNFLWLQDTSVLHVCLSPCS